MPKIDAKSFDNPATTGSQTTMPNVSVISYPNPAASANTGSKWKLAAVFFCLTTIVAVIGWVKTYDSLRRWASAHDQVRSSYSSELQQIKALEQAIDHLRNENDGLRQRVSNLANENYGLSNRVYELSNDLDNEKQLHQRHH